MRREFSAKVRAAVLKRCSDAAGVPRCESEGCGASGRLEIDHRQPDGLGGEPTLENAIALCVKCHKLKTHTQDRPRMAKADRQRKKHYLSKHRKMTRWRKFDGTPVYADRER